MLADEEVAVVEGGGGEFDEVLAGAGSGFGDFVELEGVPDLAGLALGSLDGD